MDEVETQIASKGVPCVMFSGTPFIVELTSGTRYRASECNPLSDLVLVLPSATEVIETSETPCDNVAICVAHITMARPA